MNLFPAPVLAAIICSMLIVTGCTTPQASPGTVAPAAPALHTPAVPLSSLILISTDLPDGYVVTMNREKNASEVGSLAISLGWQAGYVAEFAGPAGVPADQQNIVRQSLATYPESSLPAIVESINGTDQSVPDLRYNDFPVSGLGGNARGFTGITGNATPNTPSAAGGLLPGLEDIGGGTQQNPPVQSFAEVIFSKGSILEVIRITGRVPGPEDVIAIARKAYEKIP